MVDVEGRKEMADAIHKYLRQEIDNYEFDRLLWKHPQRGQLCTALSRLIRGGFLW